MPYGSDYEAVKLLAQAQNAREHGEHERAVDILKTVIFLCEGKDSVTCEYLLRTAHTILYGIYKSQGASIEADQYYRKAIKLGVRKEELEKA